MKQLEITRDDAGQRADRFLQKEFPSLRPSLMYKAFRKKDIKRNGKWISQNEVLTEGDVLSIYLPDDCLVPKKKAVPKSASPIEIAYEDEYILAAVKPAGVSSQPDALMQTDTMADRVKYYLYKTGAYDPLASLSFSPALCNRLDRNTGGLVLAAKTAEALRALNEKIRSREVKKFYLCEAQGVLSPSEGTLVGYGTKDRAKNLVLVSDTPDEGSLRMVTKYRTLSANREASLLEIELVTGRTHQIRAQLSALGHPLIGDKKYGGGGKAPYQKLFAYKLVFDFSEEAGPLQNISGKTLEIPCPFGA